MQNDNNNENENNNKNNNKPEQGFLDAHRQSRYVKECVTLQTRDGVLSCRGPETQYTPLQTCILSTPDCICTEFHCHSRQERTEPAEALISILIASK